MKLNDVIKAIDGEVITGSAMLDNEFNYAFASDLMSDVLTIKTSDFILLTGLVNLQTIRTAEMSDVSCIVLVRGKNVPDEIIELANESDIVLIKTNYSMFRTSGVLYEFGVKPVY